LSAVLSDDISEVQGSHAVLKVLNCEIGFQDLEKVLNLAKMFIYIIEKVWKFWIQPIVHSNFILRRWWQFRSALCSMSKIFEKWS